MTTSTLSDTAEASRRRDHYLSPPGRLTEGRALFLIIAATILLYANSLGGEFLFDDIEQIVNNSQIRSWSNLLRAFTGDVWAFQQTTASHSVAPPYYRPLFTIYLTIGYQLFGLWEPGWHLMNLGVHLGATLLVYQLARRLCAAAATTTWPTAAFAALLFGIHPAHVGAVSWISGIPDALAALFYLPALLCYARFRGGRREKKWLALSIAAYALAALCKETALALPIVIFIWEMVYTRGREEASEGAAPPPRSRDAGRPAIGFTRSLFTLIPYLLVAVLYLAVRFAVLDTISRPHPLMAGVAGTTLWLTTLHLLASYVWHLVAPFSMSVVSDALLVKSIGDMRAIISVALAAGAVFGAAAVAVALHRRGLVVRGGGETAAAAAAVCAALVFAPLLPALNIKVFHPEYLFQDRYLYLPSIGFCCAAALLLARLARRHLHLVGALAAVIVITFGAATIAHNRVWHDSLSLWSHAVRYAPTSWSVHYNLGAAHLRRKEYAAARTALLEAEHRNSHAPLVHNNLALAQANLGDTDGAIRSLRRALELDPRLLEAHNNLGTILFERHHYEAARREFARALEYDPALLPARFNLARTLAATGDHRQAIREYEAVLAQNPSDREARHLLEVSYKMIGESR